ncbi:hypothetical protein [Bradyrhizobium sp. 187]|uniref:hypothetical protein n=1 Tax=Bradyrhizobium sp. 187 TaxID=2782655 RepID=UPI001FFF78E6|nr:hypothetical protein [Bradyrhizobium sp. 187]UPJ69879.1 hypothetical protein IVB19_19265 [Bradyrhizobium sp. 187]
MAENSKSAGPWNDYATVDAPSADGPWNAYKGLDDWAPVTAAAEDDWQPVGQPKGIEVPDRIPQAMEDRLIAGHEARQREGGKWCRLQATKPVNDAENGNDQR